MSALRLRLTPRLIIGLALIAAGVLFTLDNLGALEADRYVRYWPLALVAVGLIKLAHGAAGSARVVGGGLVVVGAWLLLRNLDLVPYDLGDLWPLILVLLGLVLIFGAVRRRGEGRGARRTPGEETSGDAVRNFTLLGGNTLSCSSRHFQGGDVAAVMGGLEVDLRRAATGGGEAVLDAFAFWGGVDVWVPESWSVASEVVPVMGSFEDKTRPPRGEAAAHLRIKGFALMGGIEVSNGPGEGG